MFGTIRTMICGVADAKNKISHDGLLVTLKGNF